jgi:outer membrane murein-binding lipoprotein Lpp
MENIPLFTELAQSGVIGICIALIVAKVFIVKTCVGLITKFTEKIDALNANINELNTKIEMLSIRTKMVKRSAGQQSGILKNG